MPIDDLDYTKTNPGFHKNFLLERFAPREKVVLLKLKAWWYLTNSGQEVVLGANARMSYFLMRPITSFAEMFNLDREIICVFSPYRNFEPRTLDAFDAAQRKFEGLRTETVCRILISDDPNVEEKIDNLLKNDPEQPIIIPFTYRELENCKDEYLIRNRFRSHFYTRDLFGFLSPLRRDLYFFGRSELIQAQLARHRSGEHTSLFGLRKSGKTSIIYAIERSLRVSHETALSIDCESPSIHQLRWNELLRKIAALYADAKSCEVKIGDAAQYDEKGAADQFASDMLAIFRSNAPTSTLIIFDEIERISPRTASADHWRSGADFIYFWQTLRGFYQRNPEVYTYMLVGTNPACVEAATLNGHENPLFKSVPSTYVPPFELQQVREMVRKLGRYMGLKFEEAIYGMLADDFGGHPFLIRQICSDIHKACKGDRPQTVDKPLYERVKKDFELKSVEFMEMMVQVLRDWYPDEYAVLTYLAQDDEASFNEFANSHPDYTKHLIGYGLLQKSQNGFAFNIETIKSYIASRHRYERINLTEDEKVAELSARRNALEKALRSMIKTSLKVTMGKDKAQKAVLSSLEEKRRDKCSALDLDHLLSRDDSPLYFLELTAVIDREWAKFEHLLESRKDRIMFILREINDVGRPDAHARFVSAKEFAQMRAHLTLLEDLLADWMH